MASKDDSPPDLKYSYQAGKLARALEILNSIDYPLVLFPRLGSKCRPPEWANHG